MKRWTKEEIYILKCMWGRADVNAAAVAEAVGHPLRATYMKAHKLGLPKKPDPNTIRLTGGQQLWLRLNYPHMRNELCAGHLGMSVSSCVRWARRLGLEKTAEFMRECQAFTTRMAKESNIRNGTYPPKGVVNANLAKGERYRFKKKNIT